MIPDPPDLGKRARAQQPQRWLVIAGRGASLQSRQSAIQDLLFARHTVRVGLGTGSLPDINLKQARPHRMLAPRNTRRDARWVLLRGAYAVLPRARRLLPAARLTSWLAQEARRADHVLLLDAEAGGLRELVRDSGTRAAVWGPEEVGGILREESAWRWLAHEAARLDALAPQEKVGTKRITRVIGHLRGLEEFTFSPPADVRPQLRRVSRRRLRQGAYKDVRALAAGAELLSRFHGPSPEDDLHAALVLHAAMVAGDPAPVDLDRIVRGIFTQADAALAAGDLTEAAEIGAIALGLLFHQQLHTAVLASPLVTDPDTFLAPLRESAVGALLARPVTTRAPAAAAEGPVRVVALPGVYPQHAGPLLAALGADERADLVTLRLGGPVVAGMMVDVPILHHRLARGRSPRGPVPPLALEPEDAPQTLAEADVVVADWADKGAVWASVSLPNTARLVVRVHSVDVLSAPAQLVDWSRVDDVVFVSEHIRALFAEVMGERVAGVRQHVVTNIVSRSRFPHALTPEAPRTLGLVGWGQRVKDPLMALEILAALRAHDPSWRLRLIGSDFGPMSAAADREYVARFRERALQSDVVDNVDYPGFTRHLPEHVRHVGFILSTSIRESCPVGVLEGVAAGAVPVVREWPAFARLHGARTLFPEGHVFDTVEQAVQVVLALADPAERAAASERVLQEMAEVFSEEHTEQRLLEVVLGRP